MASKDDDTLPLSGFSEELSTDFSVDEDLIPTTQPESSERKKSTRNPDSYTTSAEEIKPSYYNSGSSFEGTQSLEITLNQTAPDEDKSVDLIPGVETEENQNSFGAEDFPCKENLGVSQAEDSLKDQASTPWDSPARENQSFSIVMDTPTKVPPFLAPAKQETVLKMEESVTEILVNDSAETVNLEQTPVKVKTSQSEMAKEKSELSNSLTSSAERSEETQIFEYSSVLLLDQPSPEKSVFTPDKSNPQGTMEGSQNGEGNSSAVAELSKKAMKESVPKIKGNVTLNREVPPSTITTEQNSSSIVTRKIDFKLSVSCFVTVNTKTNKILQKSIIDVDEIPKTKPKSIPLEPISDNTSDKSKRQSTSSSGSVYSDKTGLPFALPKRVSIVSDQTDSSEEEFSLFPKRERRALERIPWGNEYLLSLKMDDIMQVSIENQELLKRPNIPSPRKLKSRGRDRVNHLKEILESSSPERTSTPILESSESQLQPVETNRLEELLENKETGTSTEILELEKKQSEENLERSSQKENAEREEHGQCSDKEDRVPGEEHESKHQGSVNDMDQVGGQRIAEDKSSPVVLRSGLPVLARWTDKRYYSGVLSGSAKNDRWEVKFYDGALKAVREDFIIPAEWLKAGALVFALMKDEYMSGQIVDIKEGPEVSYIVELDEEKKQVSVKITDLRMTDVMAGIIREKYKPVICTPRGKADIDFDNVLSGKRLREQRTPLQPQVIQEKESSGGKKKSSSKAKKNVKRDLEITETPRNDTGRRTRGLKSENGHLVEDKVISADSPSGNEGTPLRGNSKELRRKAKPRSLSYAEETRSGKKISQSYLRSDGTPIPGTSGVKFKKQKVSSKTPKVESAAVEETAPESGVKSSSKKIMSPGKASQSTERSRRKRKLDESMEDSSQKTLPKDGSSRPKRKTRN